MNGVNGFERLQSIVEEEPLNAALVSALQVATSIADEELVSWIKLELIGYWSDNPELKERALRRNSMKPKRA
jgi:hypothetical protein